jgi:hypothetical protein
MRLAFFQRNSAVYIIAILVSAVLSYWVNSHEAVINPDAICYLLSAEEVGKSGLHAAMHLCPQAMWPFYSALIFAFAKLTHFSYQNAAFVLDGILSAVSVGFFIAIIKELGGSRRVMWLAALVILFAHEFNILRQDIVRDHGFWAFYLISMFALLKFFQRATWKMALAWGGSLLVATLFRIEGAVFLLALPFLSWCQSHTSWLQRARHFIMLNVLLISISFCLLFWMLAHPQQTIQQMGRVSEIGVQLKNGLAMILGTYQATKMALAQNVLTHQSLRDASIVVILLTISWYLVNMVGNLSIAYAILVVYAWFTRAATWSRTAHSVVIAYLLVNLVITFGFFAENHFLAKRYLIALSLVWMLWVPFALANILQAKRQILTWAVGFVVMISAIGGIVHFGHSKVYIRQAGDWLATHVPANAALYANDYQMMYYSQHFGKAIFQKQHSYNDVTTIAHGHWKQFDYLALLMGREKGDQTAWVMQEIHLPPVQVFVSDSGDHVYIYKIVHQEKRP